MLLIKLMRTIFFLLKTEELFHDTEVNEKKIKNVWGCDEFHLIGLLWMLKKVDLRYDPRIVDGENFFSELQLVEIDLLLSEKNITELH